MTGLIFQSSSVLFSVPWNYLGYCNLYAIDLVNLEAVLKKLEPDELSALNRELCWSFQALLSHCGSIEPLET